MAQPPAVPCLRETVLRFHRGCNDYGGGSGHDSPVPVRLLHVVDPDHALHPWPASLVLARFLWHERASLRGCSVLELGGGTGLGGLVSVIACGAGPRVVVTDEGTADPSARPIHVRQLAEDLVRRATDMNAPLPAAMTSAPKVEVLGLSWGRPPPPWLSNDPMGASFDWIIGADVFYERSSFDDLVATIAWVLWLDAAEEVCNSRLTQRRYNATTGQAVNLSSVADAAAAARADRLRPSDAGETVERRLIAARGLHAEMEAAYDIRRKRTGPASTPAAGGGLPQPPTALAHLTVQEVDAGGIGESAPEEADPDGGADGGGGHRMPPTLERVYERVMGVLLRPLPIVAPRASA
ncbi:hypothetical protein HK405_007916 [Cladochytrium tenue]|nr:hypothetical protein HK405_007916 [Cladochytrium tenue]